jgi:hypothetical protein
MALEVYDIVLALYRRSDESRSSETFHFAHGDLSDWNILIDPDTGAVTGLIDWEMAGFRPAWLAASAPGWFDDDSERFVMTEDQDERGNYNEETLADAVVRARYELTLATSDLKLFCHHLQGLELRALFYACCNRYPANTEGYLLKYMELEWPMGRRGPFPLDLRAWVDERCTLDETFVFLSSLLLQLGRH